MMMMMMMMIFKSFYWISFAYMFGIDAVYLINPSEECPILIANHLKMELM
jgi:hypothetical protein